MPITHDEKLTLAWEFNYKSLDDFKVAIEKKKSDADDLGTDEKFKEELSYFLELSVIRNEPAEFVSCLVKEHGCDIDEVMTNMQVVFSPLFPLVRATTRMKVTYTALSIAVTNNNKGLVATLLGLKADPNVPVTNGTALHNAVVAYKEDVSLDVKKEIIETLLGEGAEINQINDSQKTVLDIVVENLQQHIDKDSTSAACSYYRELGGFLVSKDATSSLLDKDKTLNDSLGLKPIASETNESLEMPQLGSDPAIDAGNNPIP